MTTPHVGWPLGLRPLTKLNTTVCSLACRWRLLSALQADQKIFLIETHPLSLIVRSIIQLQVVLQLLYPTPTSILHLGHHHTWLGYSARNLAFGQTPHVGWLSGLRPLVITILQCAASLAAGGYDWPCWPIESLFLLSPAFCLIVRPYYTAPSCPSVVLTTTFSPVE